MSSISINLVFMIKTWFISAKLENAELEDAKSVKDSMTDQQQNSDDIIDLFDMLSTSNLLNQTSFNKALEAFKASESPAFYQHLNHSHVNIQTWHHHMCHMSMYKVLKLCQIAKDIDINSMSASKQLCEVCIQDKSHKHVSKAFWCSTSQSDKIIHMNIDSREKITSSLDENNHYWINFVDDNSDWLNLKFLKTQDLALRAVKEFH